MSADRAALADLVTFARLEQVSGDIEPWAAVIAELHGTALDAEQALWLTKLYNAYDDLGSAWRVFTQWSTPAAWAATRDHAEATRYPCSRERRNLRGGLVLRHLDSYVAALAGQTQLRWLREAIPPGAAAGDAFGTLMPYLRRVWGVGRQTAFEWAEFTAKVAGLPVDAPHACLWESSGPRESLQRLYGNANPSREWLDGRAVECRLTLAAEGVELSWWDFETVICDFNVMRKGRYYPGQHIAMIREEIAGLSGHQSPLFDRALAAVVPAPWIDIAPGVDRELARAYAQTGAIRTPNAVRRPLALPGGAG